MEGRGGERQRETARKATGRNRGKGRAREGRAGNPARTRIDGMQLKLSRSLSLALSLSLSLSLSLFLSLSLSHSFFLSSLYLLV